MMGSSNLPSGSARQPGNPMLSSRELLVRFHCCSDPSWVEERPLSLVYLDVVRRFSHTKRSSPWLQPGSPPREWGFRAVGWRHS